MIGWLRKKQRYQNTYLASNFDGADLFAVTGLLDDQLKHALSNGALKSNDFTGDDWVYKDLQGVNLREANFKSTTLEKAYLQDADLRVIADFNGAVDRNHGAVDLALFPDDYVAVKGIDIALKRFAVAKIDRFAQGVFAGTQGQQTKQKQQEKQRL